MASTENYKQPAYSKAVQASRTIRESVGTVTTSVVSTRQIHVTVDPASYEFDQRPDSIELVVNGRVIRRFTINQAIRFGLAE